MFKIKQADRIANEKIINRLKEKLELSYGVKVKRDKTIVCSLCRESLTKSVIKGNVEGHVGSGRPKVKYAKPIMIDTDKQ